ncbi:MAG TPA: AMP-binding protein [Stellaceae bacterium]|nr:AMP-binding protein [Stellaceae bacterium]
MTTPAGEHGSLWRALSDAGNLGNRFLAGASATTALADLATSSSLGGARQSLRARSVLLATKDQLAAALAMIELDGLARRMVLVPPGVPPAHLASIAATAEAEAIVSDESDPVALGLRVVPCGTALTPDSAPRSAAEITEWILLTSGTTGVPKLVVHDLGTLGGPARAKSPVVWSTFYDIRRYGGLQIFLRAMIGGGSMVVSSADEPTADFLARASARGVTHISGTPSHWRRALMSPAARGFAPHYVRLSGEIADQAILDRLAAFYPDARLAHAFASTEAGLAFEVNDGRAGFPASVLTGRDGGVELRVVDGSLRIRSSRNAKRYLDGGSLAGPDGFVDTGDMVEPLGDRYYFAGRRDGIVNVGGQKVHPEEVEAVINSHPAVAMSLVKARRNPFTGAVVVAEVVAKEKAADEALKGEILETCRRSLARHKVPAAIRLVPSLGVASSGKIDRGHG